MGKSVIDSFSYPIEDANVVKKIERIAEREKRSKSFIVMEALREYIKAHDKTENSQNTLDNPEALAYPTPWAPLGKEELKPYSVQEDDEMIAKLERATETLKVDRQRKRDAEVKVRMSRLSRENGPDGAAPIESKGRE